MSALTIRKATASDLSAIVDILQKTKLGTEELINHLSHFFVAESDGTIIGTIGLEIYKPIGLLRSAAVLPSFQGKGVGQKLVDALVEYARGQGLSELVLLTTTATDYFEKKRFVKVRREGITGEVLTSDQFRGACPSTAIPMRKVL
ncbi:MAG: GNAT family N-acetyltransferase [Ignavibacteria bacterium]|nr:GNAT family N-acetyltransferase [Ignavibacteria bacterium]MBI3766417.1 GNAT family N-acetyltransferase [Ignavibacteriales bacterium]